MSWQRLEVAKRFLSEADAAQCVRDWIKRGFDGAYRYRPHRREWIVSVQAVGGRRAPLHRQKAPGRGGKTLPS